MAIKKNQKGISHARSLIKAGKVDKDSNWEFTAKDGNAILGDGNWSEYAKWFLAIDDSADDDTKAHYKFPHGKKGKVYRKAIIAAKQRAAQQGYTEIMNAADALLKEIDKDKQDKADSDYSTRDSPVAQGEVLTRTVPFQARQQDDGTVELSFSSEAPVRRWFGNEILLHKKGAVNFKPLLEVGAVLINHDPNQRAAVPEKVWLDEEEKKLRARIRFGSTPLATQARQEVDDGLLRGVSVGYQVHEWVRLEAKEEWQGFKGPAWIAKKWDVVEFSLTPIPADVSVGVGRTVTLTQEDKQMADKEKETKDVRTDTKDQEPKDKKQATRTAPSDTPSPTVDPAAIAAEAIEKERQRVKEIRALCREFGMEEMAEGFIDRGLSPSEATTAILKEQAKRNTPVGQSSHVEPLADERDKFRAAATDAILIRGGIVLDEPAPGADELISRTLRELAMESLMRANIPRKGALPELIGRAMTTGDFPLILADSARKSLFAGYDSAEETWREWCAVGSVSDFKTHKLVRASESDDLDQVDEHQPYRYGDMSEAQEQYAIATYGKIFAITRQAIINDDLNALTSIPQKHGEAAARKIGDLAYAVLTTNPTMGDGVALFHASHGNVGTAGALSQTTLAEAIKKMKLQKDIGGKRRLNIRAQYFIAPVALEGSAEVFFGSEYLDVSSGSMQRNPYAGSRFVRVYDARLDDSSATAWYVAGPKGKTVTLFFLNGVQKPYLETRSGWTVDGVEYKVRIDAGAKAVDWRALVKNAGA